MCTNSQLNRSLLTEGNSSIIIFRTDNCISGISRPGVHFEKNIYHIHQKHVNNYLHNSRHMLCSKCYTIVNFAMSAYFACRYGRRPFKDSINAVTKISHVPVKDNSLVVHVTWVKALKVYYIFKLKGKEVAYTGENIITVTRVHNNTLSITRST